MVLQANAVLLCILPRPEKKLYFIEGVFGGMKWNMLNFEIFKGDLPVNVGQQGLFVVVASL